MTHLRRLSDERGLTVIELVIVSALLMIVVGAALSMLDSGTRTERLQQARHSALLDLRESMTRMTKDIRQAVWIDPASTRSHIAMTTLIAGVEEQIAYAVVDDSADPSAPPGQMDTCAAAPCQLVRILGGQTEVMLANHVILDTLPFCYNPAYDEVADNYDCAENPPTKVLRIEVALEPEVFSGGPITLATEIRLRNL